MSEKLSSVLPVRHKPQMFRDEALDYAGLRSGTQLVAEVKTDAQGQLYLAAWPAYELRVATSCLLMPLAGDRVKATFDQKKLFITDILSRSSNEALVLNSGEHALHIIAPQLTLDGGAKIALQAENISLVAKTSRWISDRMNQITRRWFVQADDSYRKVKFNEDVEARNISHHAEETLMVNGRMTSIKGSAVVKVDGSQIHMG